MMLQCDYANRWNKVMTQGDDKNWLQKVMTHFEDNKWSDKLMTLKKRDDEIDKKVNIQIDDTKWWHKLMTKSDDVMIKNLWQKPKIQSDCFKCCDIKDYKT
jgi:hypothetical protein